MKLPLEGVRVCDLTVAVAGPQCTSLLAEMGAEVIKIENINARLGGGTVTLPRKPGVEVDHPYNRSPVFHEWNRGGKKGITLNLLRPEAMEAFFRLVRVSDLVVENFSPRVMPNLGLHYEALKAVKPDIIMISMPALGSTGPYSARSSLGPGIDAMSGMAHLGGFPDGPPTKPGRVMGDFNAAMIGAYAAMMALYVRSRTGKGQRIELAMREGQTFLIGEYIIDATMNGRSPMRTGNRHSSMAPHNVYPCQGEDEWVSIAVGSDDEWQRLRAALGDPEWTRDHLFEDAVGRYRHQEEIDRHLADWTRLHTAYEVMTSLQAAGVTSGAVLNGRDVTADPHFRARGYIRTVDTPEAGPVYMARPGFILTRTPSTPQAAPGFAEHNDYVFGELLGYSPQEILQMEEVQAISRVPINLEAGEPSS